MPRRCSLRQHAALDQSAEEDAEKPQAEYADFLNAAEKAIKVSAQALAEFTVACRTWPPKITVEADQRRPRDGRPRRDQRHRNL